jgi:hypothetical protein
VFSSRSQVPLHPISISAPGERVSARRNPLPKLTRWPRGYLSGLSMYLVVHGSGAFAIVLHTFTNIPFTARGR